MKRKSCFLFILASYFYLVVAGTVVSTTSTLNKLESKSEELKSRNLATVNVGGPKSVTIDSGNTAIYEVDSTNSLVGLGEKSVITVKYVVDSNNANSLSFGTINGMNNGFAMDNVYFDFELEDSRSDKSTPPIFTTCGMLGDVNGAVISNVQFRFHFSFTVRCSEANNGIIFNHIKGASTISSLLVTFTDETNPITINYSPAKGGSKNFGFVVGKIDDGNLKGVAVVGDKIVLNDAEDSAKYYFGVISGEHTTGLIQNVTVDLLEFIVYDKLEAGGLFRKASKSIEGSFFAVRNRFLLTTTEADGVVTSSKFAGLALDFGGDSLSHNFVYMKIEKLLDSTTGVEYFYGLIGSFKTIVITSCQIYLYAYKDDLIENGSLSEYYYIGGTGTITAISNSYVYVDNLKYPSTFFEMSRTPYKVTDSNGIYGIHSQGKGLYKSFTTPYPEGDVPNYQTGTLNEKSFVYYTQGLSLTDNGIKTPSNYNNEKNNHLVYKYQSDSRIPKIELIRRSSSLSEDVEFSGQGDYKETTIKFQLLVAPSSVVKIGIVCDNFLSGGGCNTYKEFTENSLENTAVIKLDYQPLQYWKTCITFNVSSSDELFNGYSLSSACYYVFNDDPSVTVPSTGVECTEGKRCQYNIPCSKLLVNYDVFLGDKKIYGSGTVTTHRGRLFIDFTYPTNEVDEGDTYIVTLKTVWYHLLEHKETTTDVTITNINKAGFTMKYKENMFASEDPNEVGELKINANTIPMKKVNLLLNCGTLICEPVSKEFENKNVATFKVKRGYLTSYDYSSSDDKTTFLISASVSSEDKQYNALTVEPIEIKVKNDIKAEIKTSKKKVELSCSTIPLNEVTVLLGRSPEKDVHVSITPNNKNLIIKPNEFTLNSEKSVVSLKISSLSVCRENITEVLTFTVNSEDGLYSSSQLTKATIEVVSVVYDHELDKSSAPVITELKLKDSENDVIEVIFDKIIYVDRMDEVSQIVDCKEIISENDVSKYGLSECKVVNEIGIEMKYSTTIAAGSDTMRFKADMIRSTPHSINSMEEANIVISDRTGSPVMSKATFNENGNQIIVVFDRTIYGITTNAESCSKVFSNNNLGTNCEVRKSSLKNIAITLGDGATIVPTNTLTLANNNPIVSSEGHVNSASGEISVDYPSNIPSVKAVINGGNVLYECGELKLDGLSSEGSYGRAFKYEWGCDNGNSRITEAITEANNANDGYLTIKGDVNIPDSFTITLKVTSFLNIEGDSSSLTITKDKSESRYLEVSIDGQNELSYRKDQMIDITGRGVVKACSESVIVPLNYEWSGKDLNTDQALSMEKFKTGDVKTISIEAGELEIGDYEFTLTVSGEDNLSGSSSVKIHIVPRDLVVVLNGASNRNVDVKNELILDISSSYDPDKYENDFLYEWECEMNNHETCKTADDSLLILESKSIVRIAGNSLKVRNIYKFTGRIRGSKTGRSSSTLVTVNVLEEDVDLTVEIIVLNPKLNDIYPHDYLLELFGNVNGEAASDYSKLSFEWIYLNDSSMNIFKPSVVGNEIMVDCSKLLSGKHRVMFKVIYKNYEFTSEFEFTVYLPPYGGYITTDKKEIPFGEKIKITTSGWVSISSLKYRFAAKVGDKISYLSDYTVSNIYEGILPVGLSTDEYKLTVVVFAMDIYNGVGVTTRYSKNERVVIKSDPPSDAQKLQGTLSGLANSNNHGQVYVVIDGVASDLERHCANNSDCYNGGECIHNKCKCDGDYMGDKCEKHKPIDCVLSEEYEYGPFNKECGLAEREKWHKVKTPAEYGGKECEIIKEKEVKVLSACNNDVDGKWSEWSDYSECDAKCEIYNGRDVIGKQYRNRTCTDVSGNGKYCVGESIEYQKCVVGCNAPLKPCPGQYIDEKGELAGIACGGENRGYCVRNPTGCKAYEPGCYAYCVCLEGYTGESCNYREDEIANASAMNSVLITSYKNSLENIHNSGDIHSTLSSNLKTMVKSYSILENDDKDSLLDLIDKSVKRGSDSKSNNLPLDALKQYVEATSTLLEHEGKERRLRRSRLLEEGKGNNVMNIIENIGGIYNKNPSESLNVNTDGISLTCQPLVDNDNVYNRLSKSTKETDSPSQSASVAAAKETSIGSSDLTLMNNYGCQSVELVEWNTIPTTTTDENLVSGMLTINLHNNEGKAEIKDVNEPIYFRQKINNPESMKDVQCSYVDEETGNLITEGVYVYYIEKMSDGSVFVTCGASHLSSFSIKTDKILPKMNVVNPISDAKLLLNYSMENALVPIILGSVLLICVLSWSYTKYKDSEELSIVTQEKANKFLSVGILDETGKKIKESKLSLVKNFALRMKSDHSWLAPALREADEIIVINRSQRILCLTCQVLTSTAINALFFGMNAENVAQLISTSIISTLCMLPCTILVPWLYKYANGCTSKTIGNKRKWWRLKSLKNRFKSYFTSGITSPELRRLKIGLLSTSSVYVIFAFVFYIVSLVVMPFGVPSLLITACLIVLILETIFSLIATNLTERVPFIFLFIVDLVMFIINVIFLVACASLSNGSTGMAYNMWKAMHKNVAMKEFNIYIENNLNCCGFRSIDDYNIQDCLNPDLLASGFTSRSCDTPLIDTMKKYGAFWGLFFVISMIFMLVKCFINLNYVFINYNKVIENNLGDFNSEITQKAGQKIITLLRHTVLKNKVRRKKEYIEWLRQRRMRSIITVCVNATVFIYILVMIYINLLYGVKFAPNQANSWIISSTISMAIDVFIQQPSLILLNSVAASTLGAVLNFAG